ncbi:glycine cleavage system aminomethyltransferase GcvT [Candidatus Marinamargulisbacteria bacterium SCGC AG-439-L15]|nr:glycine cleavage system aminomethyltransferase GcvT [Candidatus Marinamargulisbacteria bacterium SCGC AG-439-L15]
MKTTYLYENHKKRGAKFIEFGAFTLPVWFSSIKEEHFSVRKAVGVFDISHMGVLLVKGENSKSFLQRVFTNDIERAMAHKMVYGMVLNHEGMVLDDVMIGCLEETTFAMVVNASNCDKLMAWFETVGMDGVTIDRLTETHSFLAIQGPSSLDQLERVLGLRYHDRPRFSLFRDSVLDVDVTIMRTGYTGEDGLEMIVPNESVNKIWDALIDGGISPCGLGARDTLRLEAGYPLYGQELSEKIHPLMTRYEWAVKFETEFVGKDALLRLKETGNEWTTVGLEMIDRGVLRPHYSIKEGGEVTSGTQSPTLNKSIGMALLKKEYAELGTEVTVEIRGRDLKAKVVKVPFL